MVLHNAQDAGPLREDHSLVTACQKLLHESDSRLDLWARDGAGLVDLVELLGTHGIRNFVFSSSATVYGTKANAGRPLREEDLVHHSETYVDDDGQAVLAEPTASGLQSPYARSKYFCEAILADIAYSDPAWRIVALRYSTYTVLVALTQTFVTAT